MTCGFRLLKIFRVGTMQSGPCYNNDYLHFQDIGTFWMLNHARFISNPGMNGVKATSTTYCLNARYSSVQAERVYQL